MTEPLPIRLVLATDDVLLGQSLAASLVQGCESYQGRAIDVVAICHDATQLDKALTGRTPDLVLLDLELPGQRTRSTTIHSVVASGCHVLALLDGQHGGAAEALLDAIEAGAAGYVGTDAGLDEVMRVVESAARGEACVPRRALGWVLRGMVNRRRHVEAARERYYALSPREKEILRRLGDGEDQESMAAQLFISPQTARTHIQNVLRKLDVHTRLEAADLAIRLGVSDGPTREGL